MRAQIARFVQTDLKHHAAGESYRRRDIMNGVVEVLRMDKTMIQLPEWKVGRDDNDNDASGRLRQRTYSDGYTTGGIVIRLDKLTRPS